MANSAFEHTPSFTIPSSITTGNSAAIWSAVNNLGQSTIILDSGGNGRIGISGDLDVITLTSGTVTVAGTVAATTLTGAGAGITALAAANITASGTLPALNGAALTALTAANITASGTLPALNGAALTALNGTQVTTGTLPAARIAADSIIEAKLNVSNGPTNGQVLTARDGVAGGFTWEAASAGATLSGSTNNTIVTVTGSNAMIGEANLTFDGSHGGELKIDNSGGATIMLDGTAQSLITLAINGSAKWQYGMDADGSSHQKSHAEDFGFYNQGTYGVVISGNGSNKFGIGTQAGIALSGTEIPDDGIQFPASEALSTSPNNMDGYEEGTWTPVIRFGNTDSSFTYGTQAGYYTRIGRLIHVHGRLDVTGGSTGSTGNAKLGGLPWQTNVSPASYSAATIGYLNGVSFANQATLLIQSGSSYIDYYEMTEGGSVSSLTHSNFTTSHQLFFSGFYFDL